MKPVFIPFNRIGGFVQARARVKYLKEQGCFEAVLNLGDLEVNGIGLNVFQARWDLATRIERSNFLKSKLLGLESGRKNG